MSLFVASGNAPELFEPIDEALSTVTLLVNLAIEPTPSVVLGSYQGGYRKYVLTNHIYVSLKNRYTKETGQRCISCMKQEPGK